MKLTTENQQASKSDSCLTDISSRPNVAKDRVIINVGGYRHETYLSTLKVVPDSRLAWIAENASKQAEYDPENNEYFFDRHPSVFASILNYYRTGKLHCPSDVCGPLFEEELTFWGIDELQMEPCCWSNYTQHRDAQATLKAFEGLQKDSGDSELDTSTIFINPNGTKWENIKKLTWAMLELPYSSKYAQIYAFVSLVVIVLSVATFCVESMDTDNKYESVFNGLEYFYCIAFTLEFVARFVTCPCRVKFFKEAMTWVDMLSIMPLYIRFLDSDSQLKFLFVLRLVRIFRLFRFFRTMSGMQVIGHTLRASARELFLLVLILLIPMVIFSTLVFYAEQETLKGKGKYFKNIPESFWWAVITMTTVGYGDVYPESQLGKLIGTICACVGVLIVALPVSVIGSNFTLFYSHAQAQLKLPKKKKKPVLLGAAGVLVSDTSIYGNEESNEPITLPPEIHLTLQQRNTRNPSIIPRKKAGTLNAEELPSQSPSSFTAPVQKDFHTSLVSTDSITMSNPELIRKNGREFVDHQNVYSSSETCISNGLKNIGDSMVHLTTHIHRRMAISPQPTPPLRRQSQKRKKKPGLSTSDKDGFNSTDHESHQSGDSKSSLHGENSKFYSPRAPPGLSADEDEVQQKGKPSTESIPLLCLNNDKPSENQKNSNNANNKAQKRPKRFLPSLSPNSRQRRQAAYKVPTERRSAVIPGQEEPKSLPLSKSVSEGEISQLSSKEESLNKDVSVSSFENFPCNGNLFGNTDARTERDKKYCLTNTPKGSPSERYLQKIKINSIENTTSSSNDSLRESRVKILGTDFALTEEKI